MITICLWASENENGEVVADDDGVGGGVGVGVGVVILTNERVCTGLRKNERSVRLSVWILESLTDMKTCVYQRGYGQKEYEKGTHKLIRISSL